MVLSEENIEVALLEMKQLLGSMFGNSSENLDVGITGDVEFVGLDGPIVVLRLKGRFWHKRADVVRAPSPLFPPTAHSILPCPPFSVRRPAFLPPSRIDLAIEH